MSALINPIERRTHQRYGVIGKVDGELMTLTQIKLSFLVNDVSKKGMGLIIDRPCRIGEKLIFSFSGQTFTFAIRWLREAPNNSKDPKDRVYYCGVHAVVPKNADLKILLEEQPQIILEDLT